MGRGVRLPSIPVGPAGQSGWGAGLEHVCPPKALALAYAVTFVLKLDVHQQLKCFFTQKNESAAPLVQFKS